MTDKTATGLLTLFWIVAWFVAIPLWLVYNSPWGEALGAMGLFSLVLAILGDTGNTTTQKPKSGRRQDEGKFLVFENMPEQIGQTLDATRYRLVTITGTKPKKGTFKNSFVVREDDGEWS